MRLILVVLALAASISIAYAKDWEEKSGRERRLHVIAQVKQAGLQCTIPELPGVALQEAMISTVSWSTVVDYLKKYCVQGPAGYQQAGQ